MVFDSKVVWVALVSFVLALALGGNGGNPRAGSIPAQAAAPSKVPSPADDASDRTVQNAYQLCAVMDLNRLLSDRCEVSGWHQSVTIAGNMTPTTARQLCTFVVDDLRNRGKRFQSGWTLRIKSPYSGDNSIAYCDLPA